MTELEDTPYDGDVKEWAREKGWTLDKARDQLIWAGLQMGDVGPLVCFLIQGHVPTLYLRQHIGLMLGPDQALSERLRKDVPFLLEIKSRTGKRGPKRRSFEVALRNRRIAKSVEKLMAQIGPGSYDAAIKQVAAETQRGEQTVRDAYDQHRHGTKSRK